MKKEIVNNSFVFYATNLEVIEALEETNKDLAADFMKAVIEYGIYGEYDTTNPMIKVLMIQTGFGINKAKDRYAAAVENGKKGGRPKIELDEEEVLLKKQELKTWKAVAAYYGITEQSLKNKRNEWELNKNEKNPKNLNDNDNDNDNEKILKDFSQLSLRKNLNNPSDETDGTLLEAVPPPPGWEWKGGVLEDDGHHFRLAINKTTREGRGIQLD
jgi:hypothetical protein